MYRYPGILFRDYALSSTDTSWFYKYLCVLEENWVNSHLPVDEYLFTAFMVALSLLRALQNDASKPVPGGWGLCSKHGYHTHFSKRLEWPDVMARMLGVNTAIICCERMLWDHLLGQIELILWNYLTDLSSGSRGDAGEIAILRCFLQKFAVIPNNTLGIRMSIILYVLGLLQI